MKKTFVTFVTLLNRADQGSAFIPLFAHGLQDPLQVEDCIMLAVASIL